MRVPTPPPASNLTAGRSAEDITNTSSESALPVAVDRAAGRPLDQMDELAYLASFPELDPNPIVEADMEGRVRYANPAAARIFPDLGPAHPWLENWATAAAALRRTPGSGTCTRTVVVGERTYLQELCLVPHASVMRSYGLDITDRTRAEAALRLSEQTFRIVQDITERKVAEAALREAHSRTSAILASIADAFYSLDDQWRFVTVNPAAERAPFGRPASELIGKVIWDVFPKIPGTRIHQHYLDAVATQSTQHYEAPSPLNGRWYEVFMFPRPGGLDVYLRDIDARRKAEEALRVSEERIRLFIDHAPASLAMFDREMRYLSVSRRWLADYRLGDRDVRGLFHYDLFPKISEEWKQVHRRGLAGEVVSAEADRFERADGTVQWLRWEVRPWRQPSGDIGGIVIFTEDITAPTLAAAALRRYELLANHSRDIVLFMRREDGQILEANAAASAAYGFGREEMLALSIRDLRAPGTLPLTEEQMATADQHGILFETVHRRKSGETFPVEVSSQGAVVDGTRMLVSVVRDISERKRLERLYAVLSQINEAIVRTGNEQTLFREVCRIVADQGDFPLAWIGLVEGRTIRPVAASGPERSYLSDIRVEIGGELGAGPTGTCIRESRPVVNDDFASNPDIRPWRQAALAHGFRASASFPLLKNGKTIGALAIYARRAGVFDAAELRLIESLCADLSYALAALDHERRRTEMEEALRSSEAALRTANAQLVEADQHKNEFLAMLSHELRNPLTPIRNSLYILERAVPAGAQGRHAIEILGRQTGQLVRLVDDLLDITRVSRNRIQLQLRPLDFNQVVRRTLEDHRGLFHDDEISVEATFAPEVLMIQGDQERLAQIIGNLLQNAAKFTLSGGRVRVETSAVPSRGRAVLRILDNGAGMEPALLHRLFEPFMQADATLDRSRGGLGLGLALVKGLVEMHGGEVCANSDGPGKGAEFVVELPLDATPAPAASPATGGPQAGSRRVLIIEDNLDAADSLREVLEFAEHVVEVAYNGSEGLAKARQFRPDVVFCDIGLPGMDGFAVARAFRADEALKDLFLVALSGYALPEDLQRAWEAGFSRHLAKPPSMEKIEQILSSAERQGDPR